MTRDVIRRFDRDTASLATGVLAALLFAACMLAVKEHQQKAAHAEREPFSNIDSAAVESVVTVSNGRVTTESGGGGDHAIRELSKKAPSTAN